MQYTNHAVKVQYKLIKQCVHQKTIP